MRPQPDNCGQPCGLVRHFSAFALLFVALGAMASCARMPTHEQARAPVAQPLARMTVPVDGAAGKASALVIAAEFALQKNDVAGALADYSDAARLSEDPAITARAVRLALAMHDADAAAALVRRWQALGAAPDDLAGAQAQVAMLKGDRASAEKAFRDMLAAGGADRWKTLARDLLAARDSALAGRILEDLVQPTQLPANEGVWVALSQAGEHLGRHAFARKLAEHAARRFVGAASIHWAAGLRLAVGDRAGALALYKRGLGVHPDNSALRLGYAALLGDQDDYAQALRVLARGPQTEATWSARVAFAARAKDDAALRELYAGLKKAPEAHWPGKAFLLGQLAELLQHNDQALRWYQAVRPEARHGFDARLRSAILLDKTGKPKQAHALAVQLQHDYADDPRRLRTAYELDAQLYAQRGEHARAVATYSRGIEMLPGDAVLIYDRGIEKANARDIDGALRDFRAVLARHPDNVDAMNALGFTLADADRDLGEATRLLRKALAAKPDAAAIMDSWGWLQYRLGHLDQARDYLKRAWKAQQDPDIGVHLGEVLWKLGEQHDARAVFARVRELDPKNAALRETEGRLRP